MVRIFIALLFALLPVVAQGGDLVLKDIKAQSGIRLSKDELKQLMPNARIVNHSGQSTRHWTNEENGTFTAYGDAGNRMRPMQAQVSGRGEWKINEKGQYCVEIVWSKIHEKWCNFIFRVGEKYYGVRSMKNENASAAEYEIQKQ
jgi:hypothetical protein